MQKAQKLVWKNLLVFLKAHKEGFLPTQVSSILSCAQIFQTQSVCPTRQMHKCKSTVDKKSVIHVVTLLSLCLVVPWHNAVFHCGWAWSAFPFQGSSVCIDFINKQCGILVDCLGVCHLLKSIGSLFYLAWNVHTMVSKRLCCFVIEMIDQLWVLSDVLS